MGEKMPIKLSLLITGSEERVILAQDYENK